MSLTNSLTNKRNNKGQRTEPWGTPDVTGVDARMTGHHSLNVTKRLCFLTTCELHLHICAIYTSVKQKIGYNPISTSHHYQQNSGTKYDEFSKLKPTATTTPLFTTEHLILQYRSRRIYNLIFRMRIRLPVRYTTTTQRRNRAQATGLSAPKINLSNITINKI